MTFRFSCCYLPFIYLYVEQLCETMLFNHDPPMCVDCVVSAFELHLIFFFIEGFMKWFNLHNLLTLLNEAFVLFIVGNQLIKWCVNPQAYILEASLSFMSHAHD